MTVKEQELKLLLDLEGFKSILQNQSPPKKLQTNYYFDTKTLELQKSGITLRIREENEEVILCIKSKIDKSLFVTSQEVEHKITFEFLKKCIAKPEIILSLFSNNIQEYLISKTKKENLKFLGFIKNTRHCINFVENFSFELDHSIFPNGEQTYELEVEGVSTQEECRNIMGMLRDRQVNFLLSDKSKYERFLKTINML